jgi:hypothetical protein
MKFTALVLTATLLTCKKDSTDSDSFGDADSIVYKKRYVNDSYGIYLSRLGKFSCLYESLSGIWHPTA